MIDEHSILPFNFFSYGGVYTGEKKNFRYRLARTGEKGAYILTAWFWPGPFSFGATKEELITSKEFDFTEEGREQAIEWLKRIYSGNQAEWESSVNLTEMDQNLKHPLEL